jgi:hypothetical protein
MEKTTLDPSLCLSSPNHELSFELHFWYEAIEFPYKMVPCKYHFNLVSFGLSFKGLGFNLWLSTNRNASFCWTLDPCLKWPYTSRNWPKCNHSIYDYMRLLVICNYIWTFLQLFFVLVIFATTLQLVCNYFGVHPSMWTTISLVFIQAEQFISH